MISGPLNWGQNFNMAFKLKKYYIIGIMFTKFQVDWTSTSSKTTFTKNVNLKRDIWDGRMDERTNGRTQRTENTMTLYYIYRWGIKNKD